MPKSHEESITPEELLELARRIQACADSVRHAAEELTEEKIESIALATGTAKARIGQLEGFARTLNARFSKKMNEIREAQAKYKRKLAGRRKQNGG
jgi:hemerythrin-like domain-containing protein